MTEKEIQQAKAAKSAYQREYMRRWRSENKEKVREANLRYWLKRAEREAAEQTEQKKEGEQSER